MSGNISNTDIPLPVVKNNIKILPHSCFVCYKAFVRKNSLLRHYREHKNEFGENFEKFQMVKKMYHQKRKQSTILNFSDNSSVEKQCPECNPNPQNIGDILQSIKSDISNNIRNIIQNFDCSISENYFVEHDLPTEISPINSFSVNNITIEQEEITSQKINSESIFPINNVAIKQEQILPQEISSEGSFPINNIAIKQEHILPEEFPSENLCTSNSGLGEEEFGLLQDNNSESPLVINPFPIKEEQFMSSEINFKIPCPTKDTPRKKTHECNICHLKFPSHVSLRAHVGVHPVCDCCQKLFNSENELIEHYKVHAAEQNFPCDQCQEKFNRRYDLSIHKQTHCKKLHVCNICNIRFDSKINLRKHYSSHERKGFFCKICCESFFSRKGFVMHKLKKHKKKIFVCGVCFVSFYQEKAFKTHYLGHLKEGQFATSVCNESSSQENNLKEDKPDQNVTEKPEVLCEICGDTFYKKSDLNKHKDEEHNEEVHTCSICNMTFKSKEYLTSHFSMEHLVGKSFQCISKEDVVFKSETM